MLAPLFVPADRLDRLPTGLASSADYIIIDLEDGVALERKSSARNAVSKLEAMNVPVAVRVNPVGTPWHQEDIALVNRLGWVSLMQPKVASAEELLFAGQGTWALIESAEGLAAARKIAVSGIAGLVFGSVDFSVDLGCAHSRTALAAARSELVLASRLAGLDGPVDGVTLELNNASLVEDDARYAASLGFSGKLCIHPEQVGAVKKGFAPSEAELDWARSIVEAVNDGAVSVEGSMVDQPVRLRATRILERAASFDRWQVTCKSADASIA